MKETLRELTKVQCYSNYKDRTKCSSIKPYSTIRTLTNTSRPKASVVAYDDGSLMTDRN
ncbi:hypothetical protein DPMN_123359 [Dreissena polymorpha]|uniref:Uncharacterized protein n=1 Tax=Dreissena polymorpha TaxID=45954 RepID=A0A9D4GU54_DREPO|nr:hypothetical protein DPMN_123359 [Dreissena polymorpha]